jgi:outer membrane receptor protein involved in Fe transport
MLSSTRLLAGWVVRFVLILFLHLSFFICHPSFAAEVLRFYGEEVLVTAARLPVFVDKLSQVPANVTVITREDIDKSGATNLPEILNQYEGLIVADSLGFGLEANVGMRGFGGEGKNVLILLDGVRISEPFDNTLFWKLVPAQEVERIEVIRGGVSSIYGGGALAGVINIITEKGTEKHKTKGDILFGNYGEQKYYVSAGGPITGWKYYANIGKERFDGYRENSEHDETTAMVKVERDLGEDRNIAISLNNHDSKSGIAGGITIETMEKDPTQKHEDAAASDGWANRMTLYSLNYNHGSISINLFSESRVQDSIMTFASGTNEVSLITNSSGATMQLVREDQFRKSRNSIATGIEYRKDRVDNPSAFTSAFGPWPTDKAVGKNILGVFLQDNLTLADKLSINLGLRHDKEEIDLIDNLDPTQNKTRRVSNLSPKFGVVFRPDRSWSFFASAAQSFKAPEANAMLYETPGLFSPNPDIDPTIANNYEVGMRFSDREGNESKVSIYRIDSSREILLNVFATPFQKNENFDTLRRGIEISLKKCISERLVFSFGYTFNHAIFKSGQFEGKTIPLVPQNKYTAQADYKIFDELNFRIDWLGVNGQFALNDFNNLYPVEGYNVFNSKLSFKRGKLDAYFSVRNLLDEKYSAYVASNAAGTIRYNPAPGRSCQIGASFTL